MTSETVRRLRRLWGRAIVYTVRGWSPLAIVVICVPAVAAVAAAAWTIEKYPLEACQSFMIWKVVDGASRFVGDHVNR